MNVLVIGGAGYIGSHVVLELIRRGDHVVVLDDLSTGNREAIHFKATFYKGKHLDLNILDKIFNEHKIDVVMHFAAKCIVPESIKNPIEYFENNVQGVVQILKSMKKAKVKNIVFSSTAAVYGDIKLDSKITENMTKHPIQPYGQSKRACEWLIKAAKDAYKINYAIFRYFNVAGADESGNIGQSTKGIKETTHLIPVIIEVALGIRPNLQIYGNNYDTRDGSCIRDYIHVSDIAGAHILGADYIKQGNSGVFNLGSTQGYTVIEMLNIVQKVIGINIKSKIKSRRQGDPAILVASNQRAKKILGWNPKKDINEIIKSDFQWRKNKKF